ncbi:MAG: hypothetical protein NC921_04020 [Candidatus Omnitrophica bacterium]|nr:hypothetical protein [Candidatus Omnitrophota bacterium]
MDGVLRNLAKEIWGDDNLEDYFTPLPPPNSKLTLIEYLAKRPNILLKAQPYMDYLNAVNYVFTNGIYILTAIPDIPKLRENTVKWCKKWIRSPHEIIFVDNVKDKINFLKMPDDVLVDDYPFKESETDDRIYIIDRMYNKHINAINRIKNAGFLSIYLMRRCYEERRR